MALIVCLDCGKEFSDLAKQCPNCGRPVAPETKSVNKNNYGRWVFVYLGFVFLALPFSYFGFRFLEFFFLLIGLVGLVGTGIQVIYRLLQRV